MHVPGLHPHTAVRNIRQRREERRAGQRTPAAIKSALVIQGGGMRGVFGAGCLVALAELGYTSGFDEVYATSSGAINGAFFLADAMAFGATIYYEEINNARFINPLRFSKIMDLDWLFDEVVTRRKPLDVRRLCSNDIPLYIPCFDVDTAEVRVFCSQGAQAFLLDILKASTAIPILYNRSVPVLEGRFVDGGMVDPIPIQAAIANGCTDLLVLVTRPESFRARERLGCVERWIGKVRLRHFRPEVEDAFQKRGHAFNRSVDIAFGRATEAVPTGVHIATIAPDAHLGLKRLTRRRKVLVASAVNGGRKVFKVFAASDCRVAEVLTFVRYPFR